MLIVQNNISLKKYNSFGIDVSAKHFVEIDSEDDLQQLFQQTDIVKNPILVLGGGSNTLFTKNFEGLLVHINIKGIDFTVQGEDVFLTAGAGVVWNDLVQFAVNHNFYGLENLSLIPGSVGASPIQNIGAYGVEIKDVLYSCKAFEMATHSFKTFSNNDCQFSYRESIFKQSLKGKYIITEVIFKLKLKAEFNIEYGAIANELHTRGIQHPTLADISKVVSDIRVSKLPDPSTIGNAGSFFKNPIVEVELYEQLYNQYPNMVAFKVSETSYKLAAGWLIEQCGWKGKSIGNVGTWKNQALVLVNMNHASGIEIYEFSSQIIDSVINKFGVNLEREVNIL